MRITLTFMPTTNRYQLFILTLVFAVAQLDRQIVNVTLDAIGREFTLTNTQLGLLSGFVFAVTFVGFGFPIARMAAKSNRRNIVATSVFFWSFCTMLMGGAQSFIQLVVVRMGVGIGEAGAIGPAHSMIADLYPPKVRTSALATFAAGANIGVLLSLLIGGLVGQVYGWRWAFVAAALPGFFIAFLLRFTTKEPERVQTGEAVPKVWPMFKETAAFIFRDKGLRYTFIAFTLTGVVTSGALAWTPTFLIRSHGLTLAQMGVFLAGAVGIGGAIGTFTSGRLADYLAVKNQKWRFWLVAISTLISLPFVLLFLTISDTTFALSAWAPVLVLAGVFWSPTFSFIYSILPTEKRPMGTAIFLLGLNLIGFGVGPAMIGLMSDTLFSGYGEQALSFSLISAQLVGLLGAFFYWRVTHTMNIIED